MWGKYLVSMRTQNVVLVNRNIVKFYGSVTVRASLQNEIMAYLHFSELNSLQIQYHLFYMILLMFMLCGPWIKPRKIQEFKKMQFFNDFKNSFKKTLRQDIYILNYKNN